MKSKKTKRNEELNFLYFEDKSEEKKHKKKSPRGEKKKNKKDKLENMEELHTIDVGGNAHIDPWNVKEKSKKKKSKKQQEEFEYIGEEQYELETKKKGKKQKKDQEIQGEKKKRKSKKEKEEEKQEAFNFDNEIVIGVTKIQAGPAKKKTSATGKTKQNVSKKNTKKGAGAKSAPQRKKKTKKKKKKNLVAELIKWTILLGALIVAVIFFMMSPVFDITEIEVTGNEKISKETIVSLSGISLGDNIYRNKKENIVNNIKQEAYIESVEVKRTLPNKIELQVKERKTTFLLEYASSYLYMNNQGYILEISSQMLDLPIITGYTSPTEELQVGSRLNKDDLDRLEVVLKIVEAIDSNGITTKINRIDMSDKQNYTLYMEEEKKVVYLGDASHLSSRMLYIKVALEDTRGLEGEIFAKGDIEKEKVFFREKQPEPDPPPEPDPTTQKSDPNQALEGDQGQTTEPIQGNDIQE